MSTKLIRAALVVLGAVALAALAAPAPSFAADPDEKTFDFHFSVDPLTFDLLFTDPDTRSSKFEEYRDMDSGVLVRRLRLLGESGDGNRTFEFDVANASRADARYMMRLRDSGRYGLLLDYNVIPHRFGNDGTTLHSTIGGRNDYTISDATQLELQNTVEAYVMGGGSINFPFLEGLLQPYIDSGNVVSPELERRRLRALVDFGKLSRLAWKVDLRHERRDGSRPYGSTFGFSNAIELPEPVRYDTLSAEVSGEWTAKRGGLRFGFNASSFDNSYNTMTYDNPWRVTDTTDSSAYSAPGNSSIGGPSRARNVLAPDNTASRVFVAGHARFGQRAWLNGSFSFGRMEQDDRLVPHTINTAINTTVVNPAIRPPFDAADVSNLPRPLADQRVDVTHFTANAGIKIVDWASVKFRARYYDYDNKTEPFEIPGYVRMDAVWEAFERTTVPYAYTRDKLGVEFGFDPLDKTHIAVGYDLEHWDRDFREVESSDEDILHVTVDTRSIPRVVLSAGWEYSDRKADVYDTAAQLVTFGDPAEEVNNQFALRKYDQSDRKCNAVRFQATINATDSISVTLGALLRDDDYDDRVSVPDPLDPDPSRPTLPFVVDDAMGLLSEKVLHYSAELAYAPSDALSFFVFGQRSDRETFQRARQSGGTLSTDPADNWELTLDEATDTWGLGLNSRFGKGWRIDLTGSWSNSDGNSDFFSPPGGANLDTVMGFPEYDDNEWLVYSARLAYDISPHVQMGLLLARDEFTTNRFSRNGLQPYMPGALILDLQDGDYAATIAMLTLRVSF